jgi:hypothetical protein
MIVVVKTSLARMGIAGGHPSGNEHAGNKWAVRRAAAPYQARTAQVPDDRHTDLTE